MFKKRSSLSMIFRLIALIIPCVLVFSALSGCFYDAPKTEKELEKKRASMLLSLDNFSFDGLTCTGKNPKLVIQLENPEEDYYILPTSDKIKVPNGLTLKMYLGEPYASPLRPGETIDVPKNSARTVSLVLSSEGQEIIVRALVANLGDNPAPIYVGLPNIDGVKYFDGNGRRLNTYNDVYPAFGTDYKFMVGLDEDYSASVITVKCNGETLTPDGDGVYTISEITEDAIITVEGVARNA